MLNAMHKRELLPGQTLEDGVQHSGTAESIATEDLNDDMFMLKFLLIGGKPKQKKAGTGTDKALTSIQEDPVNEDYGTSFINKVDPHPSLQYFNILSVRIDKLEEEMKRQKEEFDAIKLNNFSEPAQA